MTNEIKNLMFDLSAGRRIYDAESEREISVADANETLRNFCVNELGLTNKATEREIQRALKTQKGIELFQVIEEILDEKIATGWKDDEFFDAFVEIKNLADGDKNEFWLQKDIILTVEHVSGDHHDLTVQKLNEGAAISIPTSVYAVKVGAFIREFILGRKNWTEFTDAVARAFTDEIKNATYREFMNAGSKIPPTAQFNKTGALTAATKDTFDTLLEDVSMANDNAAVVIMGTKTALKKLNALSDIDWRADSQKESVAHSGMLADYEGTILVEVPQRFAKNDTTAKLVDNNKLLIMPVVDIKPVKFVDGGETILEVSDKGDTMDDRQTYEVQRRMGIGTVITQYFGTWDLNTVSA